jgi:CheY-like chemotaxis protein
LFKINPLQNSKKYYNLSGILLIEDNIELREFLADVQIPHMNGYEFCKELRRNFDTSHIPVIMLTANNTTEHHIEGLSAGADAYMGKPFDIELLDALI